MNLHKCIDGDRIDVIVLKHYGSLENLNDIFTANKHLFLEDLILKSGMIINLPIIKEKKKIILPSIATTTDARVDIYTNAVDEIVDDETNIIIVNKPVEDEIIDNDIIYEEREPLW